MLFMRFLPRDIREAAKDHPDPPPERRILGYLLTAVFSAGADPAGPGEFTKRAFINGKLSLTGAEAGAGIIDAEREGCPMVFHNLRNIREDRDLRQKDLAAVLHVSQNTYSQYETGVISLTADVLIRLADFYGVSVDYLLDRTSNPQGK